MVHSSWFPGTQITVWNRLASSDSAHSMSSVFSDTSPATINQSSGDAGTMASVTSRLPRCPTWMSLTAQSVGVCTSACCGT